MSERDGYEPGVPCWIAAVEPDAEAASAFYAELFGWEATNLMPPESPAKYFLCRLRGRDVAAVVSQHGAPPPPAPMWATYICVESADASAANAAEAGGEVVAEPFDSPGGGRMAVLSDPAGATFCVWQPGARKGAQLVNEPGAWSMSRLDTTDLDGAKAFYGALFGWETDAFGLGDGEITLWRLQGYVGGEPDQPVARDVVGVMARIADAEAPPRWSVDFWVSDLEAVVEKAIALRGRVIAGPYEVPPFQQAVVADPHGAVFSASELVLPG